MRVIKGIGLLIALSGAPAYAQSQRPWAVTLEGAVSDMHGETRVDGAAGALRVSRRLLGYDWMRAEVALTGGSADEDRGFGTVEAGLEFRWCTACRVTPFIGGGAAGSRSRTGTAGCCGPT